MGKVQEQRRYPARDRDGRFSKKPGFNKKPSRPGKVLDDAEPKVQDVAWYTKYSTLAEVAGKLGFNHIGGQPYYGGLAGSENAQGDDIQIPLIMDVEYITTPGVISNPSSALSMQIRRLYLAMKRKFRGLNTYQYSDLAVTLFSITEFYRLIAKLERIYGTFNYFNTKNRTMILKLGEALHVDAANIIQNLADFRYGINALIVRAQSLCLPKGLDVLNRWILLESNIFKDSDDPRANYIIFDDCNKFYTYQSTMIATGGAAVLSRINAAASNPAAMTYVELLEAASDVLDILLADDDITLQLGDIISYFTKPDGSTDLMSLQVMPEDYTVVPSYLEEVALQLHNATAIGRYITTDYSVVYSQVTPSNFDVGTNGSLIFDERASNLTDYKMLFQVGGELRFNLYVGDTEDSSSHHWYWNWNGSGGANLDIKAGNTLLNTWKEVPSTDDVMEMTRLVTMIKAKPVVYSGTTYREYSVAACGTEVVLGYHIITTTSTIATYVLYTNVIRPNNLGSTGVFNLLAEFDQFDWHPMIYAQTGIASGGIPTYQNRPLADFDNARVVTVDVIEKIHDAAIMSEFEISSVDALKDMQ